MITIANAAATHAEAHMNALPRDAANTDPNNTGMIMRADEFIAESKPITAPRDVVGTHCMSRIGIDGVNKGTPQQYKNAPKPIVNGVFEIPIMNNPDATSAKPIPHVFVKPSILNIGANRSDEMHSETNDKDVRVAPIIVGPMPAVLEMTRGKKESNVDCPALYKNEITQIVPTAATKLIPSGQLRLSASYGILSSSSFAVVCSFDFVILSSSLLLLLLLLLLFGSTTRMRTKIEAKIEAYPVNAIVADKSNPEHIIPPTVGPTTKAKVQHASLHPIKRAVNAPLFFDDTLDPTSAKYALMTGDAPEQHPANTRKPRNVSNEYPRETHFACAIKLAPTPKSDNVIIFFLPISGKSDNRGQTKSAKNIPNGYALVK